MVESTADSGPVARNPWFSIWVRPRSTLRGILDRPRGRSVFWLAMAGGIAHYFHAVKFSGQTMEALNESAGTLTTLELLVSIAAGGAIGGLLIVYLGAALLGWTGSLFGAGGRDKHLEVALAWSAVPMIWGLPAWLLLLPVEHQALFVGLVPTGVAHIGLSGLLAIAQLVIPVWWFVVFLKCVGEAQGYSAWHALANTLFAYVVLCFLPLFLIFLLFFGLPGLP